MAKRIILGLLNIYQRYLSLTLPCACRFMPTCSEYAKQAIIKYGLCKGSLLALQRLLSCHPFSGRTSDDPLR